MRIRLSLVLFSAKMDEKKQRFAGKLHQMNKTSELMRAKFNSEDTEDSNDENESAKQVARKIIYSRALLNEKRFEESGGVISRFFESFREKAKTVIDTVLERLIGGFKDNPMAVIYFAVVLIGVLTVSGSLASCSLMGGASDDVMIVTSYTAEDEDILDVDAAYKELEKKVTERMDKVKRNNPGFDEYRYFLDEIGHNPYELASILTILYEDYTLREVANKLKELIELQYLITTNAVTEIRTRTVEKYGPHYEEDGEGTLILVDGPYEETEEYEYRILEISMENIGLDAVARNLGFDADQMARYEILLETYGNKKYLFEGDVYAIVDKGLYDGYRVPAEALTNEAFAKLLTEAEKYLGTRYVWGGSAPGGFDCSGFVSYVLNNCGNGIDIGRQTVTGLVNKSTSISREEAKPGDLVFFENTFSGAKPGASHVGIYVGDGMMIHAGNPVQYSSIDTKFWTDHFCGFGRLEE